MSGNTMVEVKSLFKIFSKVIAVNNISMEIKKGEFISLLGPSGCGKTTLLRMIGGLENPTSGQIYLQGNLINNVKAYKRPVNMVFQRYALFPHLNVFDNIAFGPRIRKIPKAKVSQRVSDMLKLVRLEGFENRMSNELSGGQCQRVALARALINEPLVLLLDEPLGALDLKLRKAMQIELRNIQRKLGGTFVYVTHDQEEALVLSDRIMVMNEGKIIQAGTPIEIYKNPNSVFSSRFIGESNLLEGIVQSVSKQEDTMMVKVADKNILTYFREDTLPGAKVYLSIRFESIEISARKLEEADNSFKGTVLNSIFLGPIVKYDVSVAGFTNPFSAIIHEVKKGRENYFQVTDEVYLSWNKYACTILFE